MAKTAAELADLIVELEAHDKQRAKDSLRFRCIAATEEMVKSREFQVTIDLTDKDLLALGDITEELRNLDYKFRFIERQNEKGESISKHLLISILHCK